MREELHGKQKKKNPPENTNAIWAAVITGIVTIIVTILGCRH